MAHCFTILYNPLQWPKIDILGTISFPLINNLLPLCRFQIVYHRYYTFKFMFRGDPADCRPKNKGSSVSLACALQLQCHITVSFYKTKNLIYIDQYGWLFSSDFPLEWLTHSQCWGFFYFYCVCIFILSTKKPSLF